MVAEMVLERDAHGALCVQLANGVRHVGVHPVRAFPLAAPLEGISLVGAEGKEVGWIEHLDHLPKSVRNLLEEEFALRELVPEVQAIVAMDAISVPSTWSVLTDRGPAQLTLKAEEDIRKLQGAHQLLITSRDGVQYRITDTRLLDRASQKFLERFL